MKAEAARRACLVKENDIAFNGDAVSGLKGFYNADNISEVVLSGDGSGSSKTFASKDADKIIRDIMRLPTQVHDVSNGVETIDTILLPLAQWNLLSNTRIPNTGLNLREWIIKNNPHIKKIDWEASLKTAGAGNTTRMMGYRYDPNALTLEVPQEFTMRPVQEKGLELLVPCWMSSGGVLVYYPLSIVYADGI